MPSLCVIFKILSDQNAFFLLACMAAICVQVQNFSLVTLIDEELRRPPPVPKKNDKDGLKKKAKLPGFFPHKLHVCNVREASNLTKKRSYLLWKSRDARKTFWKKTILRFYSKLDQIVANRNRKKLFCPTTKLSPSKRSRPLNLAKCRATLR